MAALTICHDFGAPQNKSLPLFPLFLHSICHEVMRPDAMILVFWMLSFKPTFSLSSFTLIKRLFSLPKIHSPDLRVWRKQQVTITPHRIRKTILSFKELHRWHGQTDIPIYLCTDAHCTLKRALSVRNYVMFKFSCAVKNLNPIPS